MELRTLRYFLAVAREENMTEAANVLHVTQPTLSRQIADLERELGCTLFERTNRQTLLTEDGMRLRQRAEEILSLVDLAEEEVSAHGRELVGNIRIGAGETRCMQAVTDAFAAMHRENPRVTIELFTGNADVVEERLERGLIDFAVMLAPVKVDKYEWLRLPSYNRGGIAVAADSRWGGLDSVTPEVLAQMPLLVSSRSSHQSVDVTGWSGGAITRESLNIVGSYDLIGNASLLVESGVACAICIDDLLQLHAPGIRFLPMEPEVRLSTYLVWKKYRIISRPCEALIERLREVCDEGSQG